MGQTTLICLMCLTYAHFAVAPLRNRVERAAVATVDSVLQRISNRLRSIRRLLVTKYQPNLESARRTEEDLRRNLMRILSQIMTLKTYNMH